MSYKVGEKYKHISGDESLSLLILSIVKDGYFFAYLDNDEEYRMPTELMHGNYVTMDTLLASDQGVQ